MMAAKSFVRVVILSGLFCTTSNAAEPLQCTVTGSGDSLSIAVKISTPHPGEMVINTPEGRMIWLQADHIPFLHPMTDDFVQLAEFVMNKRTRGSWFNDWGEPEAVSIFGTDGSYEIIITDDVESRRNSSDALTCEFTVIASDH